MFTFRHFPEHGFLNNKRLLNLTACAATFAATVIGPACVWAQDPDTTKANKLFFEAVKVQTEGDTPKAIKLLEESLKLNPSNFDALKKLGFIYMDGKEFEKAQALLEKALNQNADDVPTLLALGKCLCAQQKYDQAASMIQLAIEKSGGSPKAMFALAECFDNQARYYDAVKQYQKVLEKDPSFARAHYSIGRSFQNGGFFDLALEEYKNELELGSDIEGLYAKMGVCAAKIGLTNDAIDYFQKAIAKEPQNANTYYSLGIVYAQSNEYDKAIAAFEKCIELDESRKGAAYYNIAFIHEAQKNYDKAIEFYSKAADIAPSDVDSRYGIANIYSLRKEYDKALEIYKQIINIKDNPEPEKAYTFIGQMYNNTGRYIEALESIQTALNINSDYVPALVQKAISNIKTNRIDEAKKILLKAIELDETNYLAHFWLAYCYEFKDGKRYAKGFDISQAILHYKICMEIKPSFGKAFENLSVLLEKQEDAQPEQGNTLEAERLFAMGKRFLKNKEYESAISNFEQALTLNPDSRKIQKYLADARSMQNKEMESATGADADALKQINTFLARGQNLFLQDKYDSAIEQWEKIIKINPDHNLALKNIQKAKNLLTEQLNEITSSYEAGEKLYKDKKYREALDELNKIMIANPQFAKGSKLAQQAKELILEIIKILNEQKEIIPNIIAESNNMVIEGRYDAALENLNEALRMDSKNPAVLEKVNSIRAMMDKETTIMQKAFNTASEKIQQEKFPDAIFELNKIIAVNPNYKEGKELFNRASKQVDELMSQVQSKKQTITSFLIEGEELFTKGQYIEAMAKWRSVLSLDAKNEIASNNIERARKAMEKNKKDKEQTDNYLLEARLHMKNSQYPQAVSVLTKILAIDAENKQAKELFDKAQAAIKEQERQQNIKEEKIKKYFSSTHQLIKQNKLDKAIKELQHILALDPNNKECIKMINSIKETRSAETEKLLKKSKVEALIKEQIQLLETAFIASHDK